MKAWSRLTWLIPAVLLLVLLVLNVVLLQLRDETIPDEALVDINRMARELENGTPMHELDQTDIQVALIDMKKTSIETYMDRSRTRAVLLPASKEGSFYRFTYRVQRIPSAVFWIITTTLLGVIMFVIYLLF